jgi:hypothetical protein
MTLDEIAGGRLSCWVPFVSLGGVIVLLAALHALVRLGSRITMLGAGQSVGSLGAGAAPIA